MLQELCPGRTKFLGQELAEAEHIGELSLKEFPKPVPVLQVVGLKERTLV
jgi:hypothetical protein